MPDSEQRSLLLRPSMRKLTLYLLLCVALTGMDVFVIVTDGGIVGWFGLVFFGSLVFAVQFMPSASYLSLTAEGFIVSALFRKWPLIRWEDVSEFRVASVPPTGTKMVVFDWHRSAKQRLRKINRALVGAGEGLPDTYGLKPGELAELLNRRREEATVPRRG
jgi:hypothetical protein